MVGLQKEFGGKGPTRTRTHWAGHDMLIVLMRGGFTSAEETMYQGGRGLAVRDARHSFQDVMEERTKQLIWALTGREVVAFMTASHQSPDLMTVIFVLSPTEQDSPAAAQDQVAPEG